MHGGVFGFRFAASSALLAGEAALVALESPRWALELTAARAERGGIKSSRKSRATVPQRLMLKREEKLAENQHGVTGKGFGSGRWGEPGGGGGFSRQEPRLRRKTASFWGSKTKGGVKVKGETREKLCRAPESLDVAPGEGTAALTEAGGTFSLAPGPAGVCAGWPRESDLYSDPGDSWRCQRRAGLGYTRPAQKKNPAMCLHERQLPPAVTTKRNAATRTIQGCVVRRSTAKKYFSGGKGKLGGQESPAGCVIEHDSVQKEK